MASTHRSRKLVTMQILPAIFCIIGFTANGLTIQQQQHPHYSQHPHHFPSSDDQMEHRIQRAAGQQIEVSKRATTRVFRRSAPSSAPLTLQSMITIEDPRKGYDDDFLRQLSSHHQHRLRAPRNLDSSSGKKGSSEMTTIIAVAGSKVMLFCPLITSTSSASISPADIKWLKGGVQLPQNHRHQIHATNATLIIQGVQKAADSGTYTCTNVPLTKDGKPQTSTPPGGGKSGSTAAASVQLRVINSPKILPFEFPTDLMVGMRVRLMCSVLTGDPPLMFTWLKDGFPLNIRPTEGASGEVLSTESPAGGAASVSLPSGAHVPAASLKVKHEKDFSMLTIEHIRLSDAGNYTCLVANEASQASYSSILRVNAPPWWTIEPMDTRLTSGHSKRIDCQASGSPAPFITWKRAAGTSQPWDFIALYNSPRYILHSNGSLQLVDVTPADEGYYVCTASNGYGPDIGKLIHIQVNEPPKFHVKMKSVAVRKLDTAEIACKLRGDLPITIKWYKESDALNPMIRKSGGSSSSATSGGSSGGSGSSSSASSGSSSIEMDNDSLSAMDYNDSLQYIVENFADSEAKSFESRLKIIETSRSDSGTYRCSATNQYGHDDSYIELLIQEVPDAVKNIAIVNTTESSITIQWPEPFRGNAPMLAYHVQYQLLARNLYSGQPGKSDLANSTTTIKEVKINATEFNSVPLSKQLITMTKSGQLQPWGTIRGLKSNSLYRIRIIAENSIGKSREPSEWVQIKTQEAAPSGPPMQVYATATGPNSIKISWSAPDREDWNGLITGYYIGYRQGDSSTEMYKTVESSSASKPHPMMNDDSPSGGASGVMMPSEQRFEAHLTNLQRSQVYHAWVQAFNSKGAGPRSDQVSVKTLEDVPPSAPIVKIHSSTSNAITVSWSLMNSFGSMSHSNPQAMMKYTLYYRAMVTNLESLTANSGSTGSGLGSSSSLIGWKEVQINEHKLDQRYTVTGLECGRSYEFYMTAHNSVGKSEPSSTVQGRTDGAPPLSPNPNNMREIFNTLAATEANVNLAAWRSGGCPIAYFSIRLRQLTPLAKGTLKSEWLTLANHYPASQAYHVVRNLQSGMHYELEVTGHSSAGATQAHYEFTTPNNTRKEAIFKVGPSSSKTATNSGSYSQSGHSIINNSPSPANGANGGPNGQSPGLEDIQQQQFTAADFILPILASTLIALAIISIGFCFCSKSLRPFSGQMRRGPSLRHANSGGCIVDGCDMKVPGLGLYHHSQALQMRDMNSSTLQSMNTPQHHTILVAEMPQDTDCSGCNANGNGIYGHRPSLGGAVVNGANDLPPPPTTAAGNTIHNNKSSHHYALPYDVLPMHRTINHQSSALATNSGTGSANSNAVGTTSTFKSSDNLTKDHSSLYHHGNHHHHPGYHQGKSTAGHYGSIGSAAHLIAISGNGNGGLTIARSNHGQHQHDQLTAIYSSSTKTKSASTTINHQAQQGSGSSASPASSSLQSADHLIESNDHQRQQQQQQDHIGTNGGHHQFQHLYRHQVINNNSADENQGICNQTGCDAVEELTSGNETRSGSGRPTSSYEMLIPTTGTTITTTSTAMSTTATSTNNTSLPTIESNGVHFSNSYLIKSDLV